MRFVAQLLLALVIGSGPSLALANTQDINGVKVEDTADVRGTKLALNGALVAAGVIKAGETL